MKQKQKKTKTFKKEEKKEKEKLWQTLSEDAEHDRAPWSGGRAEQGFLAAPPRHRRRLADDRRKNSPARSL